MKLVEEGVKSADGSGAMIMGRILRHGYTDRSKQRWTAVNHALGGLFCAGLGEAGDVATFGHIYPPLRPNAGERTFWRGS